MACLAHSTPDICAVLSNHAQDTEESFERFHIITYNSTVTYNFILRMRKLDLDTLHVIAYSDASFATSLGHTSQLGYIIILCDKDDNAGILHYASCKSRKVARFVLGAETYAFANAYDFSYCPKNDLEAILERNVHLTMFIDSKSLFDVITKCSQTQERHLMIYLRAVRDAYQCHMISNTGFVRGPNNIADEMTKLGNCEPVIYLLRTREANFEVEQ